MRALCLSGGGAKGSFQVGVLKKLIESDSSGYDVICGVSVGAINSAGLAMYRKEEFVSAVSHMESVWRENVNTSAVYKRWFPFGMLHALWLKSVYDSSPLRSFMMKQVDVMKIRASGIKVSVGTVSLTTGEYHFGTQDDDNFTDWVLASSSFPIFLTPIEIGGKLWSDGGIKSVTPLGQAIRSGADEIDVILCNDPDMANPWDSPSARAIPDQLIRTLELMNDQVSVCDVKLAGLKNDLVELNPKYRKVKIRVYCPNGALPVTDSLAFDPSDIAKSIDVGYADHRLCLSYG
jgi:predicted acylesterase/phospholipase RssA